MKRQSDFHGCWALVTGASSGIGLEFCRALAADGWNLIMVSNQPEELSNVSNALHGEYGVKVLSINQNLAAVDAVKGLLSTLKKNDITPKLLINNAGIFDFKAVENISSSRIDAYVDLHIRTVTHLTREIGALMSKKEGGYILNMSSMSCWMPLPGIAMYSASKAYIRAFSRAYRVEMKHHGVSVTVACPGGIATNLFGLPLKLQQLGVRLGALTTPQKFVRNALKRTFKGRAQYINGVINRLSIVFVASLPEWARLKLKTKLLDRFN